MRKISKTLTLMGLLTPVGANALGVGEIKLHSALNQVLEAEIPLIASGSESASDIRVNLASPTAFAKAGIERPYYLSRLRFKPVVKKGKIIVKVSSKEVIREPFLNFLVEVNWSQGRMLREFTVLLDPPATFDESTITATRAPKVKSRTVTKSKFPVDEPSNYGFRSAPKSPAAAKQSEAPQQNKRNPYKPGDFVTSERNDSLWALAERVNTDSAVSQEQMMVALYEANPNAFFEKNMNALKAGQRLKIPPRETVLKRSRRQALSEFLKQTEEWSVQTASTAGQATPTGKSADSGAVTANKTGKPGSQLKLVSPAEGETIAKSGSSLAKNASSVKSELTMEMVETTRQENEELRSRLKQAEEQLARLQLMLTLKDKQLSALQSGNDTGEIPSEQVIDLEAEKADAGARQASSTPVETAENATAPLDVEPVESASKPDVPFTVLSESGAEEPSAPVQDDSNSLAQQDPAVPPVEVVKTEDQTPSADLQSEPALVAEKVAGESKPETPVKPEVNKTKPESQNAPAVPAISPTPAERAKAAPQPEEDFLTELLSEPFYLAAGGGVAILLGLFAWALVRRRNRIIEAGAESILTPPGSEKETLPRESEVKDFEPVHEDVSNAVESSFLSEFTPSDFDALEMEHDDVDPVSEADVYLAYGRYQQAEDLIRSAIENYPERDECKLKLLEIHFATEDRDAFETYAKELEAYKEEKPQFWAKVAEMGREICPDSALFAAGSSTKQAVESNEFNGAAFGDTDDSGDFGFHATDVEPEQDLFDGNDLEFDVADDLDENDEVDLFSSEEPAMDMEAEQEEAVAFTEEEDRGDDNSIEFGAFDEDSVMDYVDELETTESEAGSIGGSALSMDEDGSEEDNAGSFKFANIDFGNPVEATSELSDEISEMTDLTDVDEIETKLDLAKAYVDMDDEESARGILSEIIMEGNDEQKTEARALVEGLENKA